MTATLEREIKLRFDSVDAARTAVVATGAVPIRGRRLQEDCLLDTADEALHHQRCVLRVRMESGKSLITFKGPVQPPERRSQALVLTAGRGRRLRPLTYARAKPAIPVAGEPMIRRIIAWLATHGVRDLVLNLHHLPETLTAVVGDGADLGARVRYSWEPMILGSGGGPRLAQAIVGARTFWIINGDTLTDVNMAALAAQHASSPLARVTLALV